MKIAHPIKHSASGFTLIEVLIALVVLSIGLLGLAALQLTSLQFSTNSYFRTQATVMAYDLIDRMRANRTGFLADAYNVTSDTAAGTKISSYQSCSGSTCNCETTSCDAATLALHDLGKWYLAIEGVSGTTPGILPITATSQRATITRNATTNEVTIVINWMEKDVLQTKSWVVRL